MGYELHITRRAHWPDKGNDIGAEEWLAYLGRDAELRLQPENGRYFAAWSAAPGESWLDWSDGQIHAKNPSPALLAKMIAIARELGAAVQGDDGEIYEGAAEPPRRPRLSLTERVLAWLARVRGATGSRIERAPPPFAVGDTVRDPWGHRHTVIAVDPDANHGAGVIRTRRSDGTEHARAFSAHGFERVASP